MVNLQEIENATGRCQRYEAAKTRANLWTGLLTEAYKYTLPTRNDFEQLKPGANQMEPVWDSTAVSGVQSFASNLQYMLMPPFQRWMEFAPGPQLEVIARQKNIDEQSLKQQLQFLTEVFFQYLNQSNFALAVNEALQDMAISIGALLINEGPTTDKPLLFSSIPISQLAFEEGIDGNIQNYWHTMKISARKIKEMWPDATLTNSLNNLITSNPDQDVELVQGLIYYNPDIYNIDATKPYYYYVLEKETQEEIVQRYMNYSPWLGFRFSKSPGEIMGRGPVLLALPFIRVLNKMTEFELRSAKFHAFPMLTAASTSIFNPYTTKFEPGAVIAIESSFVGNPPIQKIDMGGDPNFAQLSIQSLQNQVKDILFADPLQPPGQGPDQTATEVSIRQQNWLRKNAASFGRLTTELLDPVIDKVLMILNNKGLIPPITIDNKRVTIKYQSPLIDLQDQADVQHFQQWDQTLQGIYGPYAVLAQKAALVPEWLAEKMKVDLKLVQNDSQIMLAFNAMAAKFQQQQAQAQPQPAQIQGAQPTVPLLNPPPSQQ